MSVTGFAISTILSIAASVWLFVVGRGAKEWRLRWLDLFGLHDADTPRPMRQAQERQLRYMSFFLLLLCVAMSVSCAFWTVFELREGLRPKTRVERELDMLRQQAERAMSRR
jgi:hypothetical protein